MVLPKKISRRHYLQLGLGSGLLLPWASGAEPLPSKAAPAVKPPQRALVVGNNAYETNARLSNAVNDARLVAQTLTTFGADVQLMVDQGRQAIRQQVVQLSRAAAAEGALVWFYFSGHGVQIDGINYLQGTDADFSSALAVKTQGIDVGWVLDMFSRAGGTAAIVVVDACRNNPFVPETRGMDGQGLAPPFQQHAGALLAYSTAPFKKALDGKGDTNGPYARALAEALERRPQWLEDAFRTAARQVQRRTNGSQVPWFQSSLTRNIALHEKHAEVSDDVSRLPFERGTGMYPIPTAAGRGHSFGSQHSADGRPMGARPSHYRPDEPTIHKYLPGRAPSSPTLHAESSTQKQPVHANDAFELGVQLWQQHNHGDAYRWLMAAHRAGHPGVADWLQKNGMGYWLATSRL
jgi:hypothetical protein